jgi:hypothetical protein
MKKLLFAIAVSLLPYLVSAQTDSLKTDTSRYRAAEEYCSILPRGKMFSDWITVEADFGDPKAFSDHEKLKDSDGEDLKFKSTVAVLNYMAQQGWLLVNTFPSDNGQHYLFRRPLLPVK